ncbi:MAG: DNA-binding domain-containing protein [Albidovulum sp.]|uniref:HvfC/BufC N-terminal domain-containing protein n=1 Tax=Albidovulum sp. TaxID=1872424 RepID=UPI003CB6E1D6
MSQTEFRTALLDPERPVPAGLTDPQGRPAGRRFDVYRNNVTVSLTEALRQAFPVIRKLVGEEFFTAMAREHVRAHPPTSPLMMHYGRDMPVFLEAFPPVQHLGYLPDIARLELTLRESYHAADATPVAAEALQALPPDALLASRLSLAPSLRLLRSRWPVHAIWSANMRGTEAPKEATAEDVLIARPEFDPEPHRLPDGAAPFVTALMRGAIVAEALDAGAEFDLTATLGLLLATCAITAINSGDQT